MQPTSFLRASPGLLVSVRNAAEASSALAGGADVIDVKEPDRGPLGAAEHQVIAEIVRAVCGRVPVTAAAGELLDFGDQGAGPATAPLPAGVSLYKIGLSGCHDVNDWERLWKQTAVAVCHGRTHAARPVAVVYADWQEARAPQPAMVLRVAATFGCPALLVDTWNKSSGNLFDRWSAGDDGELSLFIEQVREHHMALVLAGSLRGPAISAAAQLRPDLVAVRGAACAGGRGDAIDAHRVASLKQTILTAGSRSSPETSSTL